MTSKCYGKNKDVWESSEEGFQFKGQNYPGAVYSFPEIAKTKYCKVGNLKQ